MGERGVRPNAHVYAAAIGAHGAERRWESALELLDRLEADGVRADAHVASATLVVCGKAGQWAA
eukprot:7389487-Prymnesium_polylepis.1